MNILIYSSYYYPYVSGITMYTKRVAEALAKHYSVTLLTFPFNEGLSKKEDIHGVQVLRMPYNIRLSKGFLSFNSLLYYVRAVKTADLIFVNIPNVEALPLTILAKIFHKRLIALYYCDVVLKNSPFSKIIEFVLNSAVTLQLVLSDHIIMLPGYEGQILVRKLLRKKIEVIPPPIIQLPIDKQKQQHFLNEKKETLWIGFVGRIAREKGIEYLIDAIALLIKKKKQVKLLLAGPNGNDVVGENAYFTFVLKNLDQKQIPYSLLGYIPDDALGALYSVLDVLVLPSINKTEAFGMVQAEAMFCGAPVVASDLPGVREAVKVTGMGLLALPANSKDLANKIMEVLDNTKDYKKNRDEIKRIFSAEKTYHSFRQLVERKC